MVGGATNFIQLSYLHFWLSITSLKKNLSVTAVFQKLGILFTNLVQDMNCLYFWEEFLFL